ncbi:hypothetical protein ACFQ6H_27265 [Rhodococcus sp. NPDC056506]|uniref:hypothetical protein n=1 Tax=Rhodococcus sp. NPDC056506 TaxID=3345844 RepID=UPI00366C3CD5
MVSTRDAVETSLQHYGGVLTGLAERAERAADRAEEAEGGGGIGWAASNTSSLSNATPTASAGGGLAVGYSAVSGGFDRDVAVGPRAQTSGQGSIALGDNARATGNQSLAVGRAAQAPHGASSAFGASATTTKANQVMLGTSTQTVTMPGKMELGSGSAEATISTRVESGVPQVVAQFPGGDPMVLAPPSGGSGGGAQGVAVTGLSAGAPPSGPTSAGNEVVAIGHSASATSYAATAVGSSTVASGQVSTALGTGAKATHPNSTAVGMYAATTGSNQVMLGRSTYTVVAPNKFQVGPDGSVSCTLSTRLTGGKAELIVTMPSGKIISLGIDT